MDLASTDSGF